MRGCVLTSKLAGFRRGDTIVEVLIAIAVASSVLAVMYSIMNRNILELRNNQERTEATKLAQGQIESIKSLMRTAAGRDTLGNLTGGFCLNASNQPVSLDGGAPHTNIEDDGDFAGYHPGQPAASSCFMNGIYNVGIRRDITDGVSYTVFVRWGSIATSATNQAIIVYRTD